MFGSLTFANTIHIWCIYVHALSDYVGSRKRETERNEGKVATVVTGGLQQVHVTSLRLCNARSNTTCLGGLHWCHTGVEFAAHVNREHVIESHRHSVVTTLSLRSRQDMAACQSKGGSHTPQLFHIPPEGQGEEKSAQEGMGHLWCVAAPVTITSPNL